MYVFFRLIATLIRAIFDEKTGPLDSVRTPLRVHLNDLDTNFHLNNGRYLTLMDIGRFDMTIRSGLYKVLIRKRWVPVLGGAAIKYRAEIKFLQKFEIETSIIGWDEKWFYLQQSFYTGKTLAARAVVKAVFRGKARSIPTSEVLAEFGVEEGNIGMAEVAKAYREWENKVS